MRIVHSAPGPRSLTLFVLAGFFAAAALYFHTIAISRGAATVFAGLAALTLLAYAFILQTVTVLVIDDAGIFDARLGIPKIPWRDVEDVTVEASYGNRFLCIRVKNPKTYISKATAPETQRRLLYHHDLGFRRFNVDVGGLELSLLDLKNAIDARIPKPRTRKI